MTTNDLVLRHQQLSTLRYWVMAGCSVRVPVLVGSGFSRTSDAEDRYGFDVRCVWEEIEALKAF